MSPTYPDDVLHTGVTVWTGVDACLVASLLLFHKSASSLALFSSYREV